MSQNKKILKTGIIMILITLVISVSISFFLRLDKPVFLKSYLELKLHELDNGYYRDSQFELRYITNANDYRVVNGIEFIDMPELHACASEYNHGFMFSGFYDTSKTMPGQIEAMYSLRTVYIQLDTYIVEDPIDELHLTRAKVYFSDGYIQTVDIGDIVLIDDEKTNDYLEFKGSGSSDTNLFAVKEDITLLKVDSPLLMNIEDLIDIEIDNTDYRNVKGIKYSKGHSLQTKSVLSEINDPISKLNSYHIRPRIYFEDNEGNILYTDVNGFYYKGHNFELLDLIKYLRAEEAI